MNKINILWLLLLFSALSFLSPALGETCNIDLCSKNDSRICIYYFYGQGCPHCANVEPLINDLALRYPVNLIKLEVYFNNTNQELFNNFSARYGLETKAVPTVFISDKVFQGDRIILDNLEANIQYYMNKTSVCPMSYNKFEGGVHDISPSTSIELTVPLVLASAVIDSVNPCAFAVLTFLLVYLLELGNKKRMMKVGIAYIITIFIVYFMSGLGLFVLVQSTGMTRIVYFSAAVISIIAGLINLKDYFWYGKGITLAIPESKKPLLKKFMKEATIPAAIILGVLVSMFELPCTGGAYLAILGLLSNKMTLMQGVPYLLIYNFIFVLPLIGILLVIYKGLPPDRVHKWRLQNRKYLRLAMGLVMTGLGIIMLSGIA